MRQWLTLVVAASIAVPSLAAQGLPTAPPPPNLDLPRDVRDAGFEEWRASGGSGIVVAPFIATGTRYRALVRSAVARERGGLVESLAQVVAACGGPLGLTEAARRPLVADRAWQAMDSAMSGRPAIAITIVPAQRSVAPCEGVEDEAERLTMEYALAFGLDTLAHPDRDVVAVKVMVGGEELRPSMLGRALMTKVAPRAYVGPDGLSAIRVYLSFEDIAPRSSSQPDIELHVWNGTDSMPEVLALPRALGEQLRRELLPWRVRRLVTAGAATAALPVALPEPRDARLREAYRAYQAGAYADASLSALARSHAKRLRREDRATALMQVGITMAALGDDAAARTLMRSAYDHEPCARIAPSAAAAIQAADEAVRPAAARCVPIAAPRVLAYGVIPGLAHRKLEPQRRMAGFYPLLGTATAAGLWALYSARANAAYDDYQADVDAPSDAFDRAQGNRNVANVAASGVWLAWGGSALHAVWRERRLASRNRAWDAAAESGSRRTSVAPSRHGAGLAIHFF